jgi:hypothetical protein
VTDEVLDQIGMELEPVQAAPVTLWQTDDPAEVIRRASSTAKELATIVRQQKLSLKIGDSEWVKIEGWTLLASMLGVTPFLEWTRELDNGWEARVVARTMSGIVVGSGESECLRSERLWATRDDFALRGMAQTRATSRALRQPLGFVMKLAGFEPVAAEEADADDPKPKTPSFKKPTGADKKRLKALVERLIAAEHITAEQFETAARTITPWPGCLDELDAAVVSDLLERLGRYEQNVGDSG